MRATAATRQRIIDVALDVLGDSPGAGMGEIAAAAGVVRRTVYGHFPSRAELVRSIAQQAAGELAALLDEVSAGADAPDVAWATYVARMWPVVHRYRVLLALRRGEHSDEIHGLLAPVDQAVAALVQRGQDGGVFGRHLPAALLGRIAQSTLFTLADGGGVSDTRTAAVASLLTLGVPERRARLIVGDVPRPVG